METRQPQASPPTDAASVSLFLFRDGQEAYALGSAAVVEVITGSTVTPVPFTPDWMEGVISVRGKVLPVLDLFRYFQLPGDAPTQRSRLLLLAVEGNLFALWSDKILGVEDIAEAKFEVPMDTLTPLLRECMLAQLRHDDGLIFYLDLPKLLEKTRQQVLKK